MSGFLGWFRRGAASLFGKPRPEPPPTPAFAPPEPGHRCQDCGVKATIHITEAPQGAPWQERHYCDAHTYQHLYGQGAEPPRFAPPPGTARHGIVPAAAMTGVGARPTRPPAVRDIRLYPVRLIINEVHDQQVVVLQEADGPRAFPLVIGIFEITALDRRMKGLPAPRPLTHDVWADTIRALGGQLQDVLINALENQIYYTEVRVRQGDRLVLIDARPSDAFCLALICGVPILIPEWLLEYVISSAPDG